MFLKLFIIGVILTVTYGLPKDVKVASDHLNFLDSKEKEKTNEGCKIANCDVCNVNKKICISCSVGWGRNAVGTCSACEANCNLCTLDFKVCTKCLAPTIYKLISGQCKKCELSNCQTCNDDLTKCNVCVAGYRLNIDNKCQACDDPNCDSCNLDSKICEICKVDFEINSKGQCFQRGQCLFEGKRYCLNEFGIDPLNPYICKKCSVANCFHCNDDYKVCNLCNEGFGLDANNTCIGCTTPYCSGCISNKDICQNCYLGFKLEDNQCLYIPPVIFNGDMNWCYIGYYMNENRECTACKVKNCSQCDATSNCKKCMPGFYYEENTCKEYCANCSVLTTNMTCTHIIPGWGRYEFYAIERCLTPNCKYCFSYYTQCQAYF